MVVIADGKRRIVLPKTAKPGDVFECVNTSQGFLLARLERVSTEKPPLSKKRLKRGVLAGVNLDEPAFSPLKE